jgi:hypothetical protein
MKLGLGPGGETRGAQIVVLVVGATMLGLAVFVYALMAPILLGSERKALAVVVLGILLGAIDVALAREPGARGGLLPGGLLARLVLGITIGALGGLVWGMVAGIPSLAGATLNGVLMVLWLMFLSAGLRTLKRFRASRQPADPPA